MSAVSFDIPKDIKTVKISGNIPSSKNSKVATRRGVFHSATVKNFLRKHGIMSFSSSKKIVNRYKTIPCTFPAEELIEIFSGGEWPKIVGIHFIRDSKKRFDFHNACQILFDLLVAFDIIEDDDMTCVIPVPMSVDGKFFSIDKDNAGAIIAVLKEQQ